MSTSYIFFFYPFLRVVPRPIVADSVVANSRRLFDLLSHPLPFPHPSCASRCTRYMSLAAHSEIILPRALEKGVKVCKVFRWGAGMNDIFNTTGKWKTLFVVFYSDV